MNADIAAPNYWHVKNLHTRCPESHFTKTALLQVLWSQGNSTFSTNLHLKPVQDQFAKKHTNAALQNTTPPPEKTRKSKFTQNLMEYNVPQIEQVQFQLNSTLKSIFPYFTCNTTETHFNNLVFLFSHRGQSQC